MDAAAAGGRRRRVYSLEPPTTSFATKYVNNLVPALMNVVGDEGSNKLEEIISMQKLVRLGVDKALASSAHGFAWSRALKLKLDQPPCTSTRLHNSHNHNLAAGAAAHQNKRKRKHHLCNLRAPYRRKENRQLTKLRSLLPGGDEMGVNELLTEVGSYLLALEQQVNVLRCLLHSTHD